MQGVGDGVADGHVPVHGVAVGVGLTEEVGEGVGELDGDGVGLDEGFGVGVTAAPTFTVTESGTDTPPGPVHVIVNVVSVVRFPVG